MDLVACGVHIAHPILLIYLHQIWLLFANLNYCWPQHLIRLQPAFVVLGLNYLKKLVCFLPVWKSFAEVEGAAGRYKADVRIIRVFLVAVCLLQAGKEDGSILA
jgi:hypothetical protein